MKKICFSLLLAFLFLPLTSTGMELISTAAISGRAVDVLLNGDDVYCADRYGLWVLDISDPQQPASRSHWGSSGLSETITLNGTTGYLCDGLQGLYVLDLSDPGQPAELEKVASLSSALSALVTEDHLFVAAGEAGLVIFDLTDPEAPVKIGEYLTLGWAQAAAVCGNLAAVAAGAGGIILLDVTDPANPSFMAEISTGGNARQVILTEDLLIVLDREYGVSIWDVASPNAPIQLSSFSTGGWSTDMILSGDTLLVGDWFDGLGIYDVSNPGRPLFISSFEPGGFVEAMDVQGDLLALALGDDGLELWNVSSLTSPQYISQESPQGSPQDVLMAPEGWIYEAAGDAGLRLWDADLTPAEPLAQLDTPGWANALALSSTWVYLADGFEGVCIYDRSSSPQVAFVVPTEDYAGAMAVNAAGELFVSQGESGFIHLMVEGWGAPQVYGPTATQNYAYDLSAGGDLLLVCEGLDGFELFDVLNPASPQLFSSCQPAGGAWCAYLEGTTAYVGAGPDGIEVFDLSDPQAPVSIGSVEGVSWVQSLRSGGNGCLIACSGINGLYAIDTSQMPPAVHDHYDTPGIARRASALNMTLVCADEMDLCLCDMLVGVKDPDRGQPATFAFGEPFPNPFNPSTTISFSLVSQSRIEVSIFDLMGRRVTSLLDGKLNPGEHRLIWQPEGKVSAGMYFVSLKVGDQRSVHPLVYLK